MSGSSVARPCSLWRRHRESSLFILFSALGAANTPWLVATSLTLQGQCLHISFPSYPPFASLLEGYTHDGIKISPR